jgi:hypothetical protein
MRFILIALFAVMFYSCGTDLTRYPLCHSKIECLSGIIVCQPSKTEAGFVTEIKCGELEKIRSELKIK